MLLQILFLYTFLKFPPLFVSFKSCRGAHKEIFNVVSLLFTRQISYQLVTNMASIRLCLRVGVHTPTLWYRHLITAPFRYRHFTSTIWFSYVFERAPQRTLAKREPRIPRLQIWLLWSSNQKLSLLLPSRIGDHSYWWWQTEELWLDRLMLARHFRLFNPWNKKN